jgi:hypothetical protein
MRLRLAGCISRLGRVSQQKVPHMYNLRKRKAEQGKVPVDAPVPKARGLASASETELDTPPEHAEQAAAAAFLTPAATSPAQQPGPLAGPPVAPKKKGKKWEDVGLKVDTSRYLLGVASALAPSPTADAALVTISSVTRALTSRGFTQESLQQACRHLAAADASEC